MGRKTFESIGRPLPGRLNIIVSRNPDFQPEGCSVYNGIETALKSACQNAAEVFVIGGAALYEAVLPIADNVYLTEINKAFPGDTYFPELDLRYWTEAGREDVFDDQSVPFSYSFLKFTKTPARV